MTNCPPKKFFFSNNVTSCPRFAAVVAASKPAGPPPITATFLLVDAFSLIFNAHLQFQGSLYIAL